MTVMSIDFFSLLFGFELSVAVLVADTHFDAKKKETIFLFFFCSRSICGHVKRHHSSASLFFFELQIKNCSNREFKPAQRAGKKCLANI